MAAEIIDGVKVARRVEQEVKGAISRMPVKPGLATILVGEDPASAVYVGSKRRMCVELGIRDLHQRVSGNVSQRELGELITRLSGDPEVTGILLQLPVPAHLDSAALIELIHPDKDVDGLCVLNAGRLARDMPGLYPCTPLGVMELLDAHNVALTGQKITVVGRSNLVGWPLAQMLLKRDATVTSSDEFTPDLSAACIQSDVLIVATGVQNLIDERHVKPGATVIDVGIHRTEDGLVGDVNHPVVENIAALLSPVPGGVGPMTIAMLMKNTLRAAELQGYEIPDTPAQDAA
ncbi:MAG: bifunctional 5,10-methylenetetrahydrofolate dehydrogenase/5,10-methenyltetrahydrofolate cyclohydrolase [Solirubrobacteraceae bacterium]